MQLALGSAGVWVIVAAVAAALFVLLTFNGLVRLRNRVREAFSGIDVQLKRRHDLVPNLVRVVKGYAAHERGTFEAVVEARSVAAQARGPEERARAENDLSRAIDRLFVLVERYPELRADRSFRKLHEDLVALEDALQYARRYYNGTVRDLNTRVQQFPASVVATVFGVRSEPFFEVASPAEREAPAVTFEGPPPGREGAS